VVLLSLDIATHPRRCGGARRRRRLALLSRSQVAPAIPSTPALPSGRPRLRPPSLGSRPTTSAFLAGASPSNPSAVSGAITRKLFNSRLASARNAGHKARIFAELHKNGTPLSNHKISVSPTPPPPRKRQEVSIRTGVQLYGVEAVRDAVAVELTKIFETHAAMMLMTALAAGMCEMSMTMMGYALPSVMRLASTIGRITTTMIPISRPLMTTA